MSSTHPTLFNKRLGAAVRAQRILAGLTQDAVGAGLGVSFQQIQKYERGVNRVSVETLLRIAKILKTTPQELLNQAAPESGSGKAAQARNAVGDRLKLSVIQGLSRMPERNQRIALDVINALAGEAA